jgi:GH15 family glucan-1,4-alpha-glucosidase
MYMHVFDRGSTMSPGALTYPTVWIRDSAFMIHALDKLGFHEQSREKLAHLLQRQEKDGYFLSQEGEWDSNGQVIWVLLEHHKLTRDLQFLREVYPAIARGADWIERKRRMTRQRTAPHCGLLPAGISAEHLGPSDFYYWDNFWGVAGLRRAALAAQLLGRPADAEKFAAYAEDYWAEIQRSLQAAEKNTGAACLPASPYRRFDSGAIGSLCAVYPLGLIEGSDPRVVNTVRLIESQFLIGNGFFQEHFHSGVNGYLTAHLAQCYLAMRDVRVWRLVNYLLKHASSTYAWPEAFHPITRGGCMGEGHHGWAAAEWILLLRNLLFTEMDRHLQLTPLLRPKDLQPGHTFSVRAAPSYFGTVSFKIYPNKKDVLLELGEEMEAMTAEEVSWHLPFTPSKVTIDGKVLPKATPVVRFAPGVSRVVALK